MVSNKESSIYLSLLEVAKETGWEKTYEERCKQAFSSKKGGQNLLSFKANE